MKPRQLKTQLNNGDQVEILGLRVQLLTLNGKILLKLEELGWNQKFIRQNLKMNLMLGLLFCKSILDK